MSGPPAHRLFFAIRPPLTLARQMTNAAHWFGNDGRVLRPEHVHVTVDILDDVEDVETLGRRMRKIGEEVAHGVFRACFDLAVGSPRSIALRPRRRIGGLHALRERIVRRRQAAGIAERRGYRFSPHTTLGYWQGQPFSERIAPVEWEVREFVLIHSHLGQTRHEIIGRWALRDAGESGDSDEDQLKLL
ncbi:MAG: RNA 2',3'-cyclic phosphodiesterase [Pseudomonadota bacterium]